MPRALVIFCLISLVMPSLGHPELSPQDSLALQNLARSCSAHQRQLGALMAKTGTSSQISKLLETPVALNSSYWAIRNRSLSLPIQDVITARDFSAIDGRLGLVEIACAGTLEKKAWKALADSIIKSGKIDPKARERLVASWKTSVRKRLAGELSYSNYSAILETANYLAQRRIIALAPAALNFKRGIDSQLQESPAAKAKLIPALGNLSDPKWTEWSLYAQKRAKKERVLMVSARESLEALTK